MTEIAISDITLREEINSADYSLSFKEKIEITKLLDKLRVDVIETAPITKGKTDILFLHSIAPLVKNSIISCPVSLDEESVVQVYDAIKNAAKPRIHVMVPVSTVQMEYLCNKKPKAVLEALEAVVKKAKELTDDVEVSMLDATRAEVEFLHSAIKTAVSCGAGTVTICDSAGEMLPSEFAAFLTDLAAEVEELKSVKLSVECSDALNMAAACAISCIGSGVVQIKTAMAGASCPALSSVAHIFREKGDVLDITTGINMAVLDNSINKIKTMVSSFSSSASPLGSVAGVMGENIELTDADDMAAVKAAAEKLGYELNEEDFVNVYDEFVKFSKNKKVGAKELDAIIASVAMQVEPTYKLISYVINNGNIITPTAHVTLEKDGKLLQGFCIGDGPIDAAFLAIEQITGHHFDLDDFQIQSVTEGRGAMGSSIVKLRSNGKPYSGKGISTDIIGASIKAYINALNKICFEE